MVRAVLLPPLWSVMRLVGIVLFFWDLPEERSDDDRRWDAVLFPARWSDRRRTFGGAKRIGTLGWLTGFGGAWNRRALDDGDLAVRCPDVKLGSFRPGVRRGLFGWVVLAAEQDGVALLVAARRRRIRGQRERLAG